MSGQFVSASCELESETRIFNEVIGASCRRMSARPSKMLCLLTCWPAAANGEIKTILWKEGLCNNYAESALKTCRLSSA